MENNLKSSDEDAAVSAIEVQNALIYESFHTSCSTGDLATLRSILAGCTAEERREFLHHSDVNTAGTPIVDAIFGERPEVVEFLVDNGYDIETECDVNLFYPILLRDKLTALCVACAVGNYDIAKLLLEKGAQVNHCSQHSSPLIYASEYDNVELVSMLLDYGADIHSVPRSLHAGTAVLPLYQACICGYSETAELLFDKCADSLSLVKRVCLLGLLGAQCINKHDEFAQGMRHWKRALEEMAQNCPPGVDIGPTLEQLYIQEGPENVVDRGGNILGACASAEPMKIEKMDPEMLKHRHQVFKDMKLCTSVEQLDAIADDENMLRLQGLLVLENILGPSHNETTQQVSKAARNALENNDLSMTCKLFLYILEGNERRNNTTVATEYTAQLAELLLNVFTSNPQVVSGIADIVDILEASIEFTRETICKVFRAYVESCEQISNSSDTSVANIDLELKKKQLEQIKMLTELTETLIGYICIFLQQEYSNDQWRNLCVSIVKVLQLSTLSTKTTYNVEGELLKLAVYGGHSASSTLYFFQETLLPSVAVLECLLHCGVNVDRQDMMGNTALHHTLNSGVHLKIIELLIQHGAHVDISNHAGQTPLSLILKNKNFAHLQVFQYMTLKCLAATAVMRFRVQYKGQVPTVLERFIVWHGIPVSKEKRLKRSASEGDNNH